MGCGSVRWLGQSMGVDGGEMESESKVNAIASGRIGRSAQALTPSKMAGQPGEPPATGGEGAPTTTPMQRAADGANAAENASANTPQSGPPPAAPTADTGV